MKPFHLGSKGSAGIAERIINRMPPHQVYIEPFLGGGAVMRAKRPALLNIGIDLDPASLKLTRRAGGWKPANVDIIPVQSMPQATASAVLNYTRTMRSLPKPFFGFVQGDGIEFIETFPFNGSELLYCDPPYLQSTRSKRHRRMFKHEMSDADHERLLAAVLACPARVMISGYRSDLYVSKLKGWSVFRYKAATRGGVREEHLWFNFPIPEELHDYRFLGATWREREKLNRRVKNIVGKLRRLPPIERNALLARAAGSLATSSER
jgi:hypothetical protein